MIFPSSVGEVWQKPRYEIGEVLIFAPGVEEEVAAAIFVPFRAVGLRVFVHVWGGAPLWRLLATPPHPIQNVRYLLLVLLPVNVFCTPDIMVGCNTNFRKCAKLRMTISTTSGTPKPILILPVYNNNVMEAVRVVARLCPYSVCIRKVLGVNLGLMPLDFPLVFQVNAGIVPRLDHDSSFPSLSCSSSIIDALQSDTDIDVK